MFFQMKTSHRDSKWEMSGQQVCTWDSLREKQKTPVMLEMKNMGSTWTTCLKVDVLTQVKHERHKRRGESDMWHETHSSTGISDQKALNPWVLTVQTLTTQLIIPSALMSFEKSRCRTLEQQDLWPLITESDRLFFFLRRLMPSHFIRALTLVCFSVCLSLSLFFVISSSTFIYWYLYSWEKRLRMS